MSENKISCDNFKKMFVVYTGISIFCFIFYLVYNHFSHGVHSLYMTFLCGWPFIFGVLPSIFWGANKKFSFPNRLCINTWNSGVAAVTVSSLLRGIFEIAGTASKYQGWLMRAGEVMLLAAVVMYVAVKIKGKI